MRQKGPGSQAFVLREARPMAAKKQDPDVATEDPWRTWEREMCTGRWFLYGYDQPPSEKEEAPGVDKYPGWMIGYWGTLFRGSSVRSTSYGPPIF